MTNIRCPICHTDMGVKPHRKGDSWSPELDVAILTMSGHGLPATAISRIVNASTDSIRRRLLMLRRKVEA